MTAGEVMLDIDQYAELVHVSARTIRRWLDAGQLPGAVKVGGKWSIPASARQQVTTTTVVRSEPRAPRTPAAPEPVATVASVLAGQPVFIDLELASTVLGITVHALKAHADYFHLVRYGANGAWVMPQYRIHQLNGTGNPT